jgi:hypothetical protein
MALEDLENSSELTERLTRNLSELRWDLVILKDEAIEIGCPELADQIRGASRTVTRIKDDVDALTRKAQQGNND